MAVGGIDGQADLLAQRANFPNQRRDLPVQFDMNGHPVRACLGERFQQNFGPRTHEVEVERDFGQRPNGGDNAPVQRKYSAQNARP